MRKAADMDDDATTASMEGCRPNVSQMRLMDSIVRSYASFCTSRFMCFGMSGSVMFALCEFLFDELNDLVDFDGGEAGRFAFGV